MVKKEVRCPVCNNKLMFAYENVQGAIEHKCMKCKRIILINFTENRISPIIA